jgi:hypothetical protein
VRTLLSSAGGTGFMKLDYLVDYVMRKVKPLNWQAVRSYRVQGVGCKL